MLNRSRIIRRVLIVVAVLLVSGAAAAMKLTSWTPANMCFCPTPDHPDSAVKSDAGTELILPAGTLRVPLDTNTTAHSKGGALGAPVVGLAEKSPNGNANAVGKPSWAPWGNNGNRRHGSSASSSSGSGPSASLGGLWKMMNFAGRAHNSEQQSVSARVATPSQRAARPTPSPAPKPSKPSHPSPSTPPSAAVSPAIPSVVEVGTVALAGSAFREDATPVAELVTNPMPIPALKGSLGASLGHGNAANVHGGAASNLAATPEPGSFALIATGLLGIAGLLRRKRV